MVTGTAQAEDREDVAKATVFQAAGPNASSIQGTVDQFRIALGGANNGLAPGPLARVWITAGVIPGPDESRKLDVVMMDDFIYGEPQPIH